jgi:hypothetical protein
MDMEVMEVMEATEVRLTTSSLYNSKLYESQLKICIVAK